MQISPCLKSSTFQAYCRSVRNKYGPGTEIKKVTIDGTPHKNVTLKEDNTKWFIQIPAENRAHTSSTPQGWSKTPEEIAKEAGIEIDFL